MGHLLRLRISLADRAGALAQATTVIGLHGGNIRSIDVHDTNGDHAVDDLVVDFSGTPDVLDLKDDLAANAATTLVSHEESSAAEPVLASIRRMAILLQARSGDGAEALADAIADLCPSSTAWVTGTEEAVQQDAGRAALERNSPVVLRTTSLPGHVAARFPGEVYLLAVPGRERIAFVARPVTIEFTVTEIARIEALMDLDYQIERLVGG